MWGNSFSTDLKKTGSIIFILMILSMFLMLPQYEGFESNGEIVPVEELGIQGSVFFTYIEGGIVRNRIDKWIVQLTTDDDIDFYPMTEEDVMNEVFMTEIGDEIRTDTVENALANTDSTDISQKEEILENSEIYLGDSFGLMVAIGLVEERDGVDFSHGGKLVIAGTGTLYEDGTVGSVGGIRHKLLTAEDQGVDLFFVPKDSGSEFFLEGELTNEEEARQTVEDYDLNVHVVPVATLDEALTYLRKDIEKVKP
ncbi:hypothetical protein [Ammoniphilus sp. 3BR4]|uniref:hypothetical protein n=1 Tax=Ammoniphilus sp. 3BR4 TaxID=3158265 RepID=UPI003466777B